MKQPSQPALPKPALRSELRALRDGFVLDMAPGERARLEAVAAAYLLPFFEGASCVAFYQAVGAELDCSPVIAALAERGIAIALPHVTTRDVPMRFLAWQPGDPLIPAWRGLMQPAASAPESTPDIIVTPLLGFDSALQRLGQGAGYYDRAFASHPHVKKIGLGWSIQQCAAIACDPWDVPLDAVVTETGVIERDEAA